MIMKIMKFYGKVGHNPGTYPAGSRSLEVKMSKYFFANNLTVPYCRRESRQKLKCSLFNFSIRFMAVGLTVSKSGRGHRS